MPGYDESHWYGCGWLRLRKPIVKLAVSLLPELQDALNDPEQEAAEGARKWVRRLVSEINAIVVEQWSIALARVGNAEHVDVLSSKWAYALPLFGNIELLANTIAAEAAIYRGQSNRPVVKESALGRTLNQFLEKARRDARPESAHRLKVWEAINRVSDKIAKDASDGSLAVKGSDEHLAAVLEEIKSQYTKKNMPQTIDGLQSYFEEFHSEHEDAEDLELASDLAALAEETGIKLTFEMCMDRLRSTRLELFEVLVVKGKLEEDGETQKHYLQRTGISRHAFDNRYEEAAAAIRDCFENSLRFQLQGPQFR